ncbi:hypothetical protein CANCADRAFT_57064 [Tortispora caseinolytica NRRL Y-17796]|uniref:Uncharacterized protein n=1 Tax=Tortispora caseinolytica NRRL Y-17796 TaxID=767744 RepID=A0A1E4TFY3_9ASCO|nr:hypothetical protein CANCADRAFT_57064 [Tortispora caseinolytica NRRL Y-17796]
MLPVQNIASEKLSETTMNSPPHTASSSDSAKTAIPTFSSDVLPPSAGFRFTDAVQTEQASADSNEPEHKTKCVRFDVAPANSAFSPEKAEQTSSKFTFSSSPSFSFSSKSPEENNAGLFGFGKATTDFKLEAAHGGSNSATSSQPQAAPTETQTSTNGLDEKPFSSTMSSTGDIQSDVKEANDKPVFSFGSSSVLDKGKEANPLFSAAGPTKVDFADKPADSSPFKFGNPTSSNSNSTLPFKFSTSMSMPSTSESTKSVFSAPSTSKASEVFSTEKKSSDESNSAEGKESKNSNISSNSAPLQSAAGESDTSPGKVPAFSFTTTTDNGVSALSSAQKQKFSFGNVGSNSALQPENPFAQKPLQLPEEELKPTEIKSSSTDSGPFGFKLGTKSDADSTKNGSGDSKTATEKAEPHKPVFSFGSASTSQTSFGGFNSSSSKDAAKDTSSSTTNANHFQNNIDAKSVPFSFASNAKPESSSMKDEASTTNSAPAFSFTSGAVSDKNQKPFSFGASTFSSTQFSAEQKKESSPFSFQPEPNTASASNFSAPASTFSFGSATKASSASPQAAFSFGNTANKEETTSAVASNPAGNPFSQNGSGNSTPKPTNNTQGLKFDFSAPSSGSGNQFTFGAAPAASPAPSSGGSVGFGSFSAPSAPSSSSGFGAAPQMPTSFNFGTASSTASNDPGAIFGFNANGSTGVPVQSTGFGSGNGSGFNFGSSTMPSAPMSGTGMNGNMFAPSPVPSTMGGMNSGTGDMFTAGISTKRKTLRPKPRRR